MKYDKGIFVRKDFKCNILQKILLKLEYKGVIDLDKSISKISEKIGEYFTTVDEGTLKKMNYDLDSLIKRDFRISSDDVEKSKCYRFFNEETKDMLLINKYFIDFDVNCNKYQRFDYYSGIFADTVMSLKETNKFFRPIKLSHRKINSCILLDINRLYDYFEKSYYYNHTLEKSISKESNIIFDKSEKLNSFKIKDTDINLINFIEKGYIQENDKEIEAYRIVLDIEGYINDDILTYEQKNEYEKRLFRINDNIFNIFKEVLTYSFLEQLKEAKGDYSIIQGVKYNV